MYNLISVVFCNLQWVASIDLNANEEASANVTVKMTESFTEQASQVGATTVFFLCQFNCQFNFLKLGIIFG